MMRAAPFALACLLAAAAASAAEDAVAPLLERAQLWASRGRDDLAREELEKALRLKPADPDALLALGRLQLRANQEREAAATLERLRAASPSHPGVAQLSALLRVRGPDRDRLRQARQLARAGRADEAAAAYRSIFPDGFPEDDLALEYAQVLGGTKGGWEAARARLSDLAKLHPDDSRYQVALQAHLSTRKPVPPETLRALREISKDPAVLVARQAVEAWRRAVLAMDPVEESLPALRDYIAANPGETAVAERLAEVQRQIADPGLRARREGMAALEAGRPEEAAARLEAAIARYPKDAEAVGSLGLARMRQDRHAEAVVLFERAAQLEPASRDRWNRMANVSRYWATVREAREAREAGRLDEAEARARAALALDPREGQAAAELQRIEAAREATRRARLKSEADSLHAAGRDAEAIAALEEAARLDGRDPWIRLDLARLYAARGEAARGDALFRELLEKDAATPDARYAFALFLSATGREPQALATLDAIPMAGRSPEMARMRNRLWASAQAERARTLLAAGRDDEAARVLAAMREAATDDPGLAEEAARIESAAAMARARRLREAGRDDEAASIYRKLAPADREARLALADTLLDRGELAGARPLVEAELAASPDDARVLGQAGRLAIAEDRVADAVRYEQRAMALVPRDDEDWRRRRLALLMDRKATWFAGAVDALHRAGTPGKSRLDAQELPVAGREGWTSSGSWLFRVAPARVDAGTLDLTNAYEASTFGSLLLCRPQCAPGSVPAVENGFAVAVGRDLGPWRWDLGTSPLGFPVVNVVGGASTKGDLGPLSYTLEALRRPLASSLLSYAGTRDPNTGRTWGGVVTTGARLNLSRDEGGDWGAWSVAGLYAITGRNVKDNAKAELMLGGYRRLVNEADRQATVGLTGMLWRFRDNAGEYTFGHGGYYSPRSYRSLGLPVTYAARDALTSFALRASVSVAWSTTDPAPFFPTDAALQSQAEALAATTGFDPHYAGGNNGRSYGRSFAAAVERQLGAGLFAGARLDVERSTNYTPSRFLLYFRYTPDGASRPVALPPEPGLPGLPF